MTLEPLSAKARAAVTMEEQFRGGADLVERFLVDGAFRSDKPADFAITHLVGRSLADLPRASTSPPRDTRSRCIR